MKNKKLTNRMIWLIKQLKSNQGNGYISNEVGSRSSFAALVRRDIIFYKNGWYINEEKLKEYKI